MVKRNTFAFYNKSVRRDILRHVLLFHGLKIKIITVCSN